jgi:hypothetical protein
MIAIAPRPLSVLACLCIGLLIVPVAGRASAEPVFAFATTPGKLPKTVVPLHYSLDLKPDLDKLAFTGAEVVDIDVAEPTGRLVLMTKLATRPTPICGRARWATLTRL